MTIFSILKPNRPGNLFLVCQRLLTQAQVKFTNSHLEKILKKDINYPSLLTIKDTLEEYGIDAMAIRKNKYTNADWRELYLQ